MFNPKEKILLIRYEFNSRVLSYIHDIENIFDFQFLAHTVDRETIEVLRERLGIHRVYRFTDIFHKLDTDLLLNYYYPKYGQTSIRNNTIHTFGIKRSKNIKIINQYVPYTWLDYFCNFDKKKFFFEPGCFLYQVPHDCFK